MLENLWEECRGERDSAKLLLSELSSVLPLERRGVTPPSPSPGREKAAQGSLALPNHVQETLASASGGLCSLQVGDRTA